MLRSGDSRAAAKERLRDVMPIRAVPDSCIVISGNGMIPLAETCRFREARSRQKLIS
jgi:hypothetical protein